MGSVIISSDVCRKVREQHWVYCPARDEEQRHGSMFALFEHLDAVITGHFLLV